MSGQDTNPAPPMFQVFFSMLSKVHDPVFAEIDFSVDIDKRRAPAQGAGLHRAALAEPILNPVTGAEHRIRIQPDGGFEFTSAEIGPRLDQDQRTDQLRAQGFVRAVLRAASLPGRHHPLMQESALAAALRRDRWVVGGACSRSARSRSATPSGWPPASTCRG
jgi:hypothetical protein